MNPEKILEIVGLKNVSLLSLITSTLILISGGDIVAASFDCRKATTVHERLICSSEALSRADKEMGDAYQSAARSFPLKGFIQANQKGWLALYRRCEDTQECLTLLDERISELSYFQVANVYADTSKREFTSDLGMIFVLGNDNRKVIRLYGNWMPDAYMNHKDMKGYPFDGAYCNHELTLTRSGDRFVAKGESDLYFVFHRDKVIVKGHYMCTPRTSFGSGTYFKKQ